MSCESHLNFEDWKVKTLYLSGYTGYLLWNLVLSLGLYLGKGVGCWYTLISYTYWKALYTRVGDLGSGHPCLRNPLHLPASPWPLPFSVLQKFWAASLLPPPAPHPRLNIRLSLDSWKLFFLQVCCAVLPWGNVLQRERNIEKALETSITFKDVFPTAFCSVHGLPLFLNHQWGP